MNLIDRIDQGCVQGGADGGDVKIDRRDGCVWVYKDGCGLVMRKMIQDNCAQVQAIVERSGSSQMF